MNHCNLIFVIVCYQEKYWETQSFKDLVQSFKVTKKDSELCIGIFDNTDLDSWDVSGYSPQDNRNINIHYYRDASNPGIAAAFNHFGNFANDKKLDWIVFLDQDTSLPRNFYEKYFTHSIKTDANNIAFPKVYSDRFLISPSRYKFFRTSLIKESLPPKLELSNITAINSGLMIKSSFFLENNGYNKNLRIDFCDHEFIERINHKKYFADILDMSLQQNFSAETNNLEKAIFRYKMYVKDLNTYASNKNKFLFFLRVDLPHLLKLVLQYRSLVFLNIRLNS